MFRVKLRCIPRISIRVSCRAITNSPISFTPITAQCTNSRMTYGSSKQIRFGLQILCHESAVAGSDTSNLGFIHKRMFFAELLCPLDNLVSCFCAPSIDVAGRKFLSESLDLLYRLHILVRHTCGKHIVLQSFCQSESFLHNN